MLKMHCLLYALAAVVLTTTGAVSAPATEVIDDHPRLFLRSTGWDGGRGLTVAELRRRYSDDGAAVVREQLEGSLPNDALRALILQAWPDSAEQSAAAADAAIERLLRPIDMDGITTTQGVVLGYYAMAYDWLYNHPEFDEDEKQQAAENMAAAGDRLARELDGGSHIFHTRMYGWPTGVALAGLALAGHHPGADRLLTYGHDYYVDRLFPARRLQDGAVHNSFGYGRKYSMWQIGHFLSCWHSATGHDYWAEIERDQHGWTRNELLFNIYGRYPDGTYLRFGDSYSWTSDHYTFRAVSERTAAYRDPAGQDFLNALIEENAGRVVEKPSAYVYFLHYDPDLSACDFTTLPLRKLFSVSGLGMVVWKSGWEDNGTTVFFKCGDYFGNHGHFDQGHVDVFRRAPLLIDSGHYLTFSGEFRTEYWHRSVAHNTILITDPANPAEEGGQRVFSSQGSGTIGEYLADERAETGELVEYVDGGWYAFAAGDFTAAYPDDRAELVTREVAFVDDRFLVVLDKVHTDRPELVPRVLWHCPVYPDTSLGPNRFDVEREGGRAIVTTLLPADARRTWVDSFRVGNRKIMPEGKYQPVDGMGVGRFEITDPDGGTEQLFLHVIEITDSPADPNAYDPPLGEVSAEVDQGAIYVRLEGRELIMSVDGTGLLH